MSADEPAAPAAEESEPLTADTVAVLIRQRSHAGMLTTTVDLRVAPDDSAPADQPPGVAGILATAQMEHADVQALPGADGTLQYYSTDFMTEAYARLLVARAGDSLALMAGIVREYSELYPRPFPLGGFERPPFSLSRDAILQCLSEMGALPDYADIAPTTTSTGHVYLYSSRCLEADYAAALAEWIDVGQPNSP